MYILIHIHTYKHIDDLEESDRDGVTKLFAAPLERLHDATRYGRFASYNSTR